MIDYFTYTPSESCAAEPPEHGTSTDTLILCRACGHEVAFGTDIHFVPSRMALSSRNDTSVGGRRIHVQLFENPHGHQFEVGPSSQAVGQTQSQIINLKSLKTRSRL
ncbi:hypothetical protein ATANTOWER_012688 [Ataeniobius toweri]|uniref:CULT domain-containing protein n=1 Tax=Ataeniobius toweri TaxID=208326 RepID=A0ABU7C4S4_9TELE|nr:hypothetical protein [Ataeniobius toweri]